MSGVKGEKGEPNGGFFLTGPPGPAGRPGLVVSHISCRTGIFVGTHCFNFKGTKKRQTSRGC